MVFNKNLWAPKLLRLVSTLIVVWIVFLLFRSLWQNWALKHSIDKLEEQIVTLEQQKKDLSNLLVYYQSDSFKELEARKKLGLKKPGEKMVILPATPAGGSASPQEGPANQYEPSPSPTVSPSNFPTEVENEKKTIQESLPSSKIPNWALWWQYFTK